MERFKPRAEMAEKIKELVKGEPDAFLILVGAMKYNPVKERYESGSFKDADENALISTGESLATGGKDRVLAAEVMGAVFPQAYIVPMSRTRDPEKPTYAEVAKSELERKGVPAEQILLEENSISTITEFKEAARLWDQHQWSNIVFISSNWHLPRCEALFNHIENFADNEDEVNLLERFVAAIKTSELQVQFLGSTDVLSAKSDHYKTLFAAVEKDEGVISRKEREEAAIKQIEGGHYGGKELLKKIME